MGCFCGMSMTAFADDATQILSAENLQPNNGIPLVIVRVNEDQTNSIDKMNDSFDHSVRCESGSEEIILPEGYSAPDGLKVEVPAEKMTLKYVRGRGNSTWARNKKPYKVEQAETTASEKVRHGNKPVMDPDRWNH